MVSLVRQMSCTPRTWKNPFTKIIQSGDIDTVREYVAAHSESQIIARDKLGRTSMYDAISTGNLKIVRELIAAGVDVFDVYNDTGATALHLTAGAGNLEIVTYLINFTHQDVNITDKDSFTPIDYALKSLLRGKSKDGVSRKHLDTIMYLISHGGEMGAGKIHFNRESKYLLSDVLKRIQDHYHPIPYAPELCRFLKDSVDSYFYGNPPPYYLPEIKYDGITGLAQWRESKNPVVLGWDKYEWDNDGSCYYMRNRDDVEYSIVDLNKICPLLIYRGNEHNQRIADLIKHISTSIKTANEQSDTNAFISQICIAPAPTPIFQDVIGCSDMRLDMKSAIMEIKELTALVDMRRTMPKQKLKSENRVIVYIADLHEIVAHNKKIIGEIQTLAMWGNDVGVHVIAITGIDANRAAYLFEEKPKLPSIVLANFPSRLVMNSYSGTLKKYLGRDVKREPNLGDAFLVSPYLPSHRPIIIRLPGEYWM